jgi:hypothetical protein
LTLLDYLSLYQKIELFITILFVYLTKFLQLNMLCIVEWEDGLECYKRKGVKENSCALQEF